MMGSGGIDFMMRVWMGRIVRVGGCILRMSSLIILMGRVGDLTRKPFFDRLVLYGVLLGVCMVDLDC
jgi:hypothetical protein